jgi:sulfur-oxidizing protein SoxY
MDEIFHGARADVTSRRAWLRTWLGAGLALAARTAGAQARAGAAQADPAHRAQIDVPILADDPVAIPLMVSVDHPMEPDHFIRSLDVVLATDPVPAKGTFLFTPASGRASVAYQMRSGQGGDLVVVVQCTRHGRFETRQPVRVAPGGCALPPGASTKESGGSPSLRLGAAAKPGAVVPVWTSLKHTSHTGLAERQGKFVPERPPYYVERVTVFVGDDRVSEFRLTPAVSPDPRIRFFVRAASGRAVRVAFVNNRKETWEVSQPLG